MLTIEEIPSVHHASRRGEKPRATVIHYTGWGSVHSTARWFAMEESKNSSHYLIGRQGHIIKSVELDRAAWHCGQAEIVIDGECYSNANQLTIGIELANYGHVESTESLIVEVEFAGLRYDNGLYREGLWEVYPDAQIDALQALLLRLSTTYPEAVQNLVGHEEIAVPLGRKRDPGPLFPWDRFSRRIPRRTKRAIAPRDG